MSENEGEEMMPLNKRYIDFQKHQYDNKPKNMTEDEYDEGLRIGQLMGAKCLIIREIIADKKFHQEFMESIKRALAGRTDW
jgi:hypothetical protein